MERRDLVRVRLKKRDQKTILQLTKKGKESVRVICRALILKQMNEGLNAPKAAKAVGVSAKTARSIAHKYAEGGLKAALYDKDRTGQPLKLNEREKNRIIAMVCSDPPDGYARWSIRLIAEEVQKRKLSSNTIERESIRILLKSHGLKPWLKKNVVHREIR
jgi:transposase